MSVRVEEGVIRLDGRCHVEDAEPLLQALQEARPAAVDLCGATFLHLAVVQLLLATRPRIAAAPADPFIRQWILPLLADGDVARSPTQPL